jgi:transcription elongation factor GreA
MKGRISNESPLGAALLGRELNETITIEAPDGSQAYRILQIA